MERLAQLKQAEALVLQDPSYYDKILPNVVALAGQPDKSLRRWIGSFLKSTFASGVLDSAAKEELAVLGVVDALQTLVNDELDGAVLKSVVLCSSLIYPLLFRRMYVPLTPLRQDAKTLLRLICGQNSQS
jgi:hypothetical protein